MDGADVIPASSSSVGPSRSLLSGVVDDGPSCFFVLTGIKLIFILLNFFFVLMGEATDMFIELYWFDLLDINLMNEDNYSIVSC